jgi:hypothetical protein
MLVIAALGLWCARANAQDNHYAWMQFGSRNSILNNASVCRFEDQSAVIINPATLSAAQVSSFNFNTNAIGINFIKFNNGLGQGFTITNSNLNILPSMASGVIRPKRPASDLVIGYAIYASNMDRLNFSDRTEARFDIIPEEESPGEENYIAQYNIINILDELTITGGLGWKLSDNFSLGVSQNFIYRTQEFSRKYSAYAIPDAASAATVDIVGINSDYYARYYRVLTYTRFGLTARLLKWDLGLTVTTPTLGIMGTGYVLADYGLDNVRSSEDPSAPRESYVANSEFDKLKAKYHYPLHVALGLSRSFGDVRLYGSLFWFSELDRYEILDPDETAGFIQPPGTQNPLISDEFLNLWSANQGVFNGSISADWTLRPDLHLLGSFRSDGHFGLSDQASEGLNPAIKQWDNYHFTVGAQKIFSWSEIVAGIRYTRGYRNDFPQPISFDDPTEENYFLGERETGTIIANGFQLLLSYTFTFGKAGANP